MRAAHRLMRRHNLDALDMTDRTVDWAHVGPVKQRFAAWEKVRAGLLTRHFFVQAIWVRSFRVKRGTAGRQLELMGTPENLALAVWVHDTQPNDRETCDANVDGPCHQGRKPFRVWLLA